MRTLHINPRKFQEPFILYQIDHKAVLNGMDDYKIKNKVLMFGSIMNKALTAVQGQIDDSNNVLSIKVVYQKIEIKPKDRIIYNDNQYIVTQIDRDFYNKNETIFQCSFEKEFVDEESKTFDYKLDFKMRG